MHAEVPDLSFSVTGVEAVPYAAAPLLMFKLRIANPVEDLVHTCALRCQIRIECGRRPYTEREGDRLLDLFGARSQWSGTLRSMLWTHVSVTVPAFTKEVVVDLPVPCTFDFNIAVVKYFDGLEDGSVPLSLLFSGTVFHAAEKETVQVSQISSDKEAAYSLPVSVWKAMMEMYYPNSAWLCLRKDVFDRLHDYKKRNGIATWEQALEGLLK